MTINTIQLLFGGFAGYLLGCGVWALTTFYIDHYASLHAGEDGATPAPGPEIPTGLVPRLATIVRLLLATWGIFVFWQTSQPALLVSGLLISGLLATITLVDCRTRRIPNALVLALLACAAIQLVWPGQLSPKDAGLGLLVGGGSFFLLALIGRGAMGVGDVKLAGALGALLGYPLILPALVGGVVAGGVGALVLLATRRAGRKDSMAYGPYLALGAWLALARTLVLWLF